MLHTNVEPSTNKADTLSLSPTHILAYVLSAISVVFCIASLTGLQHENIYFSVPNGATLSLSTLNVSSIEFPFSANQSVLWHQIPIRERRASLYGNQYELCMCFTNQEKRNLKCYRPDTLVFDPHTPRVTQIEGNLYAYTNLTMLRDHVTAKDHVSLMARSHMEGTMRAETPLIQVLIRHPSNATHPYKKGGIAGSCFNRGVECVAVPQFYNCYNEFTSVVYALFQGRGLKIFWCSVMCFLFLGWTRGYVCRHDDEPYVWSFLLDGGHFLHNPSTFRHVMPVLWQLPIFLWAALSTGDAWRLCLLLLTLLYGVGVDT
eukprot:PhF_6_TR14891/c0_g1_i2/m.23222